MNKVTGGAIPAEIWRRMMVAAHANLEPHDFAWMAAAEASQGLGADAAVPDPAASGDPAEPDADPRKDFYSGLAKDFDRAADDPAAPAPREAAPEPDSPPEPDAPPRTDKAPEPNP